MGKHLYNERITRGKRSFLRARHDVRVMGVEKLEEYLEKEKETKLEKASVSNPKQKEI